MDRSRTFYGNTILTQYFLGEGIRIICSISNNFKNVQLNIFSIEKDK